MKLLRIATWINLVWASLLLVGLAALVVMRVSASAVEGSLVVFFFAALANEAVAFAALNGRRWALVASFLVAVGSLIYWLPWVVLNFHAFFTDHPRYLDSPGTILVVAANGLIFCVPALFIVLAYALRFRVLLNFFRQHDTASA